MQSRNAVRCRSSLTARVRQNSPRTPLSASNRMMPPEALRGSFLSSRQETLWASSQASPWPQRKDSEHSTAFAIGPTAVEEKPKADCRTRKGNNAPGPFSGPCCCSREREPKPKPRWDVHLPGVGNRGGSLAGVFRPLIAGPSGSAVSPRLSGWTARPRICRPSPARPPCSPGTDCQWPPLSPSPR